MERAESSRSRPITLAVPAISARRATSQDRLHRQPQKRQRRHLLLRLQRHRLLRLQRPRQPLRQRQPRLPQRLQALAVRQPSRMRWPAARPAWPATAKADSSPCRRITMAAPMTRVRRVTSRQKLARRPPKRPARLHRRKRLLAPRQRFRILLRVRRTSAAPVTQQVASSRSLLATNRLRTRNA